MALEWLLFECSKIPGMVLVSRLDTGLRLSFEQSFRCAALENLEGITSDGCPAFRILTIMSLVNEAVLVFSLVSVMNACSDITCRVRTELTSTA